MSFILDAIAKSEQERQQQLAPDASRLAIPVVAPVSRSRKGPYLIAGALLLNAILLLLWIQLREPAAVPVLGSSGAGIVDTPAAVEHNRPPAEPQQAPAPVVPAETPKPVTDTMHAESWPEEEVDPFAYKPVLQDTQKKEQIAVAETVDTNIAESPTEIAQEEVAVLQEANFNSTETAPDTDTVDSVALVQPPVEEAPVQPEPKREISRLSDLPSDVRQALPSMVFTGHLYSSNPRARYVYIGDRQIVAGQRIADDLILDSITPTGVVVEFHQYLIEVGVLQNWSLN